MTDDELRTLFTVYEALRHEWRLTMARPDVTAGWLLALHRRLTGPEFTGSGSELVEVWRLDAIWELEERIGQVAPAVIALVTGEKYDGG